MWETLWKNVGNALEECGESFGKCLENKDCWKSKNRLVRIFLKLTNPRFFCTLFQSVITVFLGKGWIKSAEHTLTHSHFFNYPLKTSCAPIQLFEWPWHPTRILTHFCNNRNFCRVCGSGHREYRIVWYVPNSIEIWGYVICKYNGGTKIFQKLIIIRNLHEKPNLFRIRVQVWKRHKFPFIYQGCTKLTPMGSPFVAFERCQIHQNPTNLRTFIALSKLYLDPHQNNKFHVICCWWWVFGIQKLFFTPSIFKK